MLPSGKRLLSSKKLQESRLIRNGRIFHSLASRAIPPRLFVSSTKEDPELLDRKKSSCRVLKQEDSGNRRASSPEKMISVILSTDRQANSACATDSSIANPAPRHPRAEKVPRRMVRNQKSVSRRATKIPS